MLIKKGTKEFAIRIAGIGISFHFDQDVPELSASDMDYGFTAEKGD